MGGLVGASEAAAAKQQLVHFKGLTVVSPPQQIIPHLLVSVGTRPTTLTLTAAHLHLVTCVLGSACGRTAHRVQAGLLDSCICCFNISTVCRHQPKVSPSVRMIAACRGLPSQHQHRHQQYNIHNRKLCPIRTHMSIQGQKKN